MTTENYLISPIGYVRCGEEGFCLEINSDFRLGLKGLDDFSHLNVLWWCDLVDDPQARAIIDCEQPYKGSPDRLGIFATRSPARPNPIALTVVIVLAVDHERGIIRIPYIDAEDGTPIIDLKPYHPSADRVRDVSLPEWCCHWPQWLEDSASFDWEAEFVFSRQV